MGLAWSATGTAAVTAAVRSSGRPVVAAAAIWARGLSSLTMKGWRAFNIWHKFSITGTDQRRHLLGNGMTLEFVVEHPYVKAIGFAIFKHHERKAKQSSYRDQRQVESSDYKHTVLVKDDSNNEDQQFLSRRGQHLQTDSLPKHSSSRSCRHRID